MSISSILNTPLQVTVSTPAYPAPYSKVLGPKDGTIARALLSGHSPSIAKAVMGVEEIKEAIMKQMLVELNEECTRLCKREGTPLSPFRSISADKLVDFRWKDMTADIEQKAPLLFKILYSLVSSNDHRNKMKVGAAHFPGICSAAAILLKERNREMCGLQSLVSLLMYSCHAEKQVKFK